MTKTSTSKKAVAASRIDGHFTTVVHKHPKTPAKKGIKMGKTGVKANLTTPTTAPTNTNNTTNTNANPFSLLSDEDLDWTEHKDALLSGNKPNNNAASDEEMEAHLAKEKVRKEKKKKAQTRGEKINNQRIFESCFDYSCAAAAPNQPPRRDT